MDTDTKKIHTFKDLGAWREAHALVLEVYAITRKFPKEELFGIVSQMRRAAVSITSNIAEGFGRISYKEKSQFYSIAQGSLAELESQILVAKDLGYLSISEALKVEAQVAVVSRVLGGLARKSRAFG